MNQEMYKTVNAMLQLGEHLTKSPEQSKNRENMLKLIDEVFNLSDIPAQLQSCVVAYVATAILAEQFLPLDKQDWLARDVKIFSLGLMVGYEVTRRG